MLPTKFIAMIWNFSKTELINKIELCTLGIYFILLLGIFSPFYSKSDAYHPFEYQGSNPLSQTLRTSPWVFTAHCCSIAVMIPIAIEIVLDYYSKKIDKSVPTLLVERSVLILFLISPSIVYLAFRESKNLETLYVTLVYCRFKATAAIIYQMVKSQFHGPLRWTYLTALFTSILATSLTAIAVIFNWTSTFQYVTMLVNSAAMLTIMTVLLSCCYKTHQSNSRKGIEQCNAGEFLLYAYAAPTVILSVAYALWFLYYPHLLWMQQDEKTTLFQTLLSFVFSIVLSIVPAQGVKLGAVANTESLKLKQAFVRYVAHEIRSPLNVVHAGLDILRSELKISFPTAAGPTILFLNDLVEDIFSSSESAILILNDLLQYENLDAGTFSLDQNWQPLLRLLAGKLKWAAILAAKNRVSLTVSDSTLASEFGLVEKYSEFLDSVAMSDTVVGFHDTADLEGQQQSEELCLVEKQRAAFLFIDTYKVEQVIRNLITNALKFTPVGGKVDVKLMCNFDSSFSLKPDGAAKAGSPVGVLRVEVVDTGAGIALEDQAKVFGQFAQFNRNELQKGGGSGLGLWISRRIVNLHNGTMGFSSEGRGFGSTFYFEIPLYGSKGSVSFAPTAYITQPVDKKRSCVITDSLHSLRWPKPPNLMVSIGPYMMIPSKEGTPTNSTPANASAPVPSSSQRFLRPSVLNLRRNNAAVHCSLDTNNHHHHNNNNDLDIQSIIEHEDDSVKSPSNFVVKFRSEEVSKSGNEEVNATIARTYPSSTPLSLCAPLVESSPGIRMDGEDVDNLRRARSSSTGNSFQQKGSPPPYSGGGPASSEEQLFVRAGGSNDRRNRLGEHDTYDVDASSLDPLRVRSTSCTSSKSSSGRKPLRFLVVDDSLMNRKMMARILNADRDYAWLSNAYIQDADDGVTCLEIVRKERESGFEFDIVLMDYHMLSMHGPETVRKLRKEMNFTGTIIGVTGNAQSADVANFIQDGANEVLIKPLTRAKIVDAIKAFVK